MNKIIKKELDYSNYDSCTGECYYQKSSIDYVPILLLIGISILLIAGLTTIILGLLNK